MSKDLVKGLLEELEAELSKEVVKNGGSKEAQEVVKRLFQGK